MLVPVDPPAPLQSPRRADAQRNRDRLIEVASEVFTEKGVNASLEEIARRSNVGIGTLYRHFPTREHLVEVLYRREIEMIASAATEMQQTRAPDIALEEWMHRFVGYMAAKRGMASSLKLLTASNSTLFTESSTLLRSTFDRLLLTAIAAGTIRNDIETTDVLHALSSIYSIPDTPDWRDRSHRLITLIMDGLRHRSSGRDSSQ